jgi:hypothetical protein
MISLQGPQNNLNYKDRLFLFGFMLFAAAIFVAYWIL